METFWTLINKYNIKIPLLQRDYAQGRTDERTTDIRDLLLDHLKEGLEGTRHVDFDFVYGTVKDNEEYKDVETLVPLDGQQRLTTLFLLHWYFNIKEEGDLQEHLLRFSYETRISARDFTRAIIDNGLLFEEIQGELLSGILIEKKWFQHQWLIDPTVKGMLVTLDAIHKKYETIKDNVIDLLKSNQCPITFRFLELEKFNLDDELYIKMNARGKPLSTFENFKAQFEQVLEEAGHLDRSKEFPFMIDKDWTDLLWDYRSDNYTIDTAFVELFTFLTTSIAIKEKTIRNPRIFSDPYVKQADLKSVYEKKEHVDFLFNALSLWKKREEVNKDFDKIENQLPLFISNNQLFDVCVDEELLFNLIDRIYFYTIIQKKLNDQEDDIIDTLRVVRNLVHRIRQMNNGQINSNLRFDTIGPIFRTIDKLIATDKPIYEAILLFNRVEGFAEASWNQEQEKAKLIKDRPEVRKLLFELEDISIFKGAIHQLLPVFRRYPEETLYYTKELLKLPDNIVSRAMLTIDDYSIQIGWSNLGPRYVFGGSYYREFIWTSNNDLTDLYTQLIELLIAAPNMKVKEKFYYIIENYNEWSETDWSYYFVKYPSMLKGSKLLYVYENDEYGIERLSGVNLQADHINPFYDAVIDEINDANICSYGTSAVRLSDKSKLVTTFGLEFNISKGKWTYNGKEETVKALAKYEESLTETDLVKRGVALVRFAHDLSKVSKVVNKNK